MDRLTRKLAHGTVDFVDGKGYSLLTHAEGVILLFNRLYEYEETGLTPQQFECVQRERDIQEKDAIYAEAMVEYYKRERDDLVDEVNEISDKLSSSQRERSDWVEAYWEMQAKYESINWDKKDLENRVQRLEQVNVNCRVLAEDLTLEKEALIEVLEKQLTITYDGSTPDEWDGSLGGGGHKECRRLASEILTHMKGDTQDGE